MADSKKVYSRGMMRTYRIVVGLLVVLAGCGFFAGAASGKMAVQHDLRIRLFPEESRLTGVDEIKVSTLGARRLVFHFSEKVSVSELAVNGVSRDFAFQHGRLYFPLHGIEQTGTIRVRIAYRGIFDDPVPVLPANTDNPGYGVTGAITGQGCFLLAGAGWYPRMPGAAAHYQLTVDAPQGIVAVTAGRLVDHATENGRTISRWEIKHPVRGLALSAGRYTMEQKMTAAEAAAVTFLLPQSRHLAAGYLDATSKYLEVYSKLFGEYPFSKFAVVENFFPTGYGFPSYTLLGSTVLHLPFIIHTSLPHEIAHSWWGNGVFVDPAQGNWCEGLTTYVSDYYLKERQSVAAAKEYRLQTMRNYAALVNAANDFALKNFQSRRDPVTKTIGYDKGAMVFHMLRQMLGEEAFWGGLRDVYTHKRFEAASWQDLRHFFERRGKRSLKTFFDQWVAGKGAPRLALEDVRRIETDSGYKVQGRILQTAPFFDLGMELGIEMADSSRRMTKINVYGRMTPFEVSCNTRPHQVALDPQFDIFRQLYPSEVPPSVNTIKGASSVIVVYCDGASAALVESARTLLASLGLKSAQTLQEAQLEPSTLNQNDLLFIGWPREQAFPGRIPADFELQQASFVVNGREYSDPEDAFWGVFTHQRQESHVVGLFLPLSDAYAQTVARKITHYGRYSYLAFSRGQNQDKGTWPIERSPLIYTWDGD